MFSNEYQGALLETTRLVLRPLSVTDEREIFLLRSDPSVNKYLDRPLAKSTEDARSFIEKIIAGGNSGSSYYWAITQKDEDVLLGTACIWNIDEQKSSAEIGYELLPAQQGKGYMKEVIEAIITFAFTELKLGRLDACMDQHNERSAVLVLKSGFRFIGEKDGEHQYILENKI